MSFSGVSGGYLGSLAASTYQGGTLAIGGAALTARSTFRLFRSVNRSEAGSALAGMAVGVSMMFFGGKMLMDGMVKPHEGCIETIYVPQAVHLSKRGDVVGEFPPECHVYELNHCERTSTLIEACCDNIGLWGKS